MREKRKTLDKKNDNLKLKKIAKKQKLQERGITLIALVVTIIILLILAGVTLNIALSDNGLFSKAKKAAEDYKAASESEAINMYIISNKLGEDDSNLGVQLVDRTVENSSSWNIILKKDDMDHPYGTGWNYIEKGTNLKGYGELKNSWLINNETGEIIQLEDNSYNHYSYESTVAVTKDENGNNILVFNFDSANAGNDIKSLGKNTKLYKYDSEKYSTSQSRKEEYEKVQDKNVNNAENVFDRQEVNELTEFIDSETNAFNFNGNNYIEVYNEDGFDFSNGMTYEFYGKLDESASENVSYGLLGLWSGYFKDMCRGRFCIISNKQLYYTLNAGGKGSKELCGGWSQVDAPWNQLKDIGTEIKDDIYVFITFDPKASLENNDVKQSLFIYENGVEVLKESTWLDRKFYEDAIQILKDTKYLELGRVNVGYSYDWNYLKGLCYSLRLYNKALTETQIQDTFKATTTFHKNPLLTK